MKSIVVDAINENIETVNDFIHESLTKFKVSDQTLMEVDLAVEEIYVNIANYAYNPDIGKAEIRCEVTEKPLTICVEFLDGGVPYNPLENEDPDITLSAEERSIGGLGVFLVKQVMDTIDYQFKNNKNILTIKKTVDKE